MKKFIWIALIVLSLAIAQIACKTAAERQAESTQEAAAAAKAAEPTEPEVAEAAEDAAEEEVVEVPADSPEGIFLAAMEGIETDVLPFIEGIPVPDDGAVSMEDHTRMDFVTSMSIDDCAQFYRDTFSGLGLIEIEELSDKTDFSETVIFGGYPQGKAIRVKISNLSQLSRNIKVHILEPNDL